MSEDARRLRSQRRSWAHPGSGHDRLVRIAGVVLPVGIGVLAAFLVMSPLFTGGDLSFVLDKNKVDVASERLRIESAEYRGEDNRGRPFRLVAGSAVQRSSREPVVQLSELAAQIVLDSGTARIVAERGAYDMDTDKVAVEGPLRFATEDGYTLETHDATVDLKTRTLESGGRVSGRTPMGTFSGDKISADLEKRSVAIDGNARLRIVPKRANRR